MMTTKGAVTVLKAQGVMGYDEGNGADGRHARRSMGSALDNVVGKNDSEGEAICGRRVT